MLIMPHTHANEAALRAHFFLGRREPGITFGVSMPQPSLKDKQIDEVRYARTVPIKADFRVTALIENGTWVSPDDLEAARSLLASRFDLKLGLWDLVRNPTLRRSLLEAVPTPEAIQMATELPPRIARRARDAATRKAERERQESAALELLGGIAEPLVENGWKEPIYGNNFMRYPLTEPLARWPAREGWPAEDPMPLASLSLTIGKRHASIALSCTMSGYVDVYDHLTRQLSQFEKLALPNATRLDATASVLWSATGGWGDAVDWKCRFEDIAAKTPVWAELLSDLVKECLHVRNRRF
jgi:hypothetical protein